MRKVAWLLTLFMVSAVASASTLVMKVDVKDESTIPFVTIYVNSKNLNDLESKYDSLYNALMKTKATISDLILFMQLKYKILEMYDKAIVDGIKKSKDVSNLLVKKRLIESKADVLLLKVLYSLKETKGDMGWFDNYGNHKSFNDVSLLRLGEIRITNCYSDIGKSRVVKGDTIHITGFVYVDCRTNSPLEVWITDPYNGISRKTIISTELGENRTNQFAEIVWTSPNGFDISINTSHLSVGLKQVEIKFGNYSAYCQFVVERPYMKIQHFGNLTRIETNYPYLVVNGKTVKVSNGVVWVDDRDPKIVPKIV